jgi:hypothetical protein
LLYLTPVHFNCPDVFLASSVDVDLFSGATKHFRALVNQVVHIGRFDVVFAPSGETQE